MPARRDRARSGAWLYVLPALLMFGIFIAYPIIANIAASLVAPQGGASLVNYRHAGSDPVFWTALRNSIIWVVLCVVFETAIGFVLALAIEMYLPSGQVVFRTLLFLPMVITPSVIALVFTTIYAPDYGLLYGMFNAVGLGESFPVILGNPDTATFGVIAVNVWQWCGFFVLMYCVGLSQIDRELLAAAAIDGAVGFARVRYVIWPLLRSTTTSLAVLGTIQALQQFPLIFLMTEGGPADSTQTLATFIFQTGFTLNQMHYASAVAVVLFLMSLALIVLQYRMGRARGRRMPKPPISARLVAYVVLLVGAALSLIPTIYMVDISLRNSEDSFSPMLIAPRVTFANWSSILSQGNLAGFFFSSALVSLVTVVLTLVCVVGLSYAISRLKIRGGQVILLLVVSALLLPLAALLIPIAQLLAVLGLTNNYLGLIGPETALGIPFGTVIVKAAMDDIPVTLEEAARIDGAGSFTILIRIIVPLIRPSLIVVAIWQFLYSWNEFFLALVIMTKDAIKTLPLAPLYYQGPFMTDPGKLFAILTLIAIVPMVAYIVMQRWFVAGLMEGSVKG